MQGRLVAGQLAGCSASVVRRLAPPGRVHGKDHGIRSTWWGGHDRTGGSGRLAHQHPGTRANAAQPSQPGGPGDQPGVSTSTQASSSDHAGSNGTADGAQQHSDPAGPQLSAQPAQPEQQPKKRMPHRWRIVFAMALAFVLCNMDKVGGHHAHARAHNTRQRPPPPHPHPRRSRRGPPAGQPRAPAPPPPAPSLL